MLRFEQWCVKQPEHNISWSSFQTFIIRAVRARPALMLNNIRNYSQKGFNKLAPGVFHKEIINHSANEKNKKHHLLGGTSVWLPQLIIAFSAIHY